MIGTPSTTPIPEGMATPQPVLHFPGNKAASALAEYTKVLGPGAGFMELTRRMTSDGKRVEHAAALIGGGTVFLDDFAPLGSAEGAAQAQAWASLFLYVKDVTSVHKACVEAGWTVQMPLQLMYWGDRMTRVQDPWGHCWSFATNEVTRTEEQMQQAKESDGASAPTDFHY